jgi:hypothetical protein
MTLDSEWFIYQNGEILCSLHFWAIPGKTGTECVKIASDSCSPVDYCEVPGIWGFKILCFVNHFVYWGKHDTEMCSKLKIICHYISTWPPVVVLRTSMGQLIQVPVHLSVF